MSTRSLLNSLFTVAALALTALLILTALPLASTAAPRLEPQPPEPLTALNSTEATESAAPLSAFSARSVASVVQSPSTTTRTSTALRGSPTMFIENVRQFDERVRLKVNDDANRKSILAYFPDRSYLIGLHAAMSTRQAVSETLYLDTFDPDNDGVVGPISSTVVLSTGEYFLVTISGTWSAWRASQWSSVCKGIPEDWPQIPSPGTTNGKVGVDPEYMFAVPSGSTACEYQEDPPYPISNVQVSLDSGTTWFHPAPINPTYNSTHIYTYLLKGEGLPVQFRYVDYPTNDNYGIITIRIEEPGPTPIPRDPLALSASSTYATKEHVIARTSVYNSSSASKTFSVTVSLLKDGATEASLTQTPTVAGYGTVSLTFDFGTHAAGSYQIKAELFEGATLLKTKWANFTVLDSTGIRLAGEHAEELKGAVESEFDQMATIPARALADEAIRFGLDALQDYAVGKFADFAAPIQDAAGIPRSSSDSAVSQIRDKLGILRLKRQNIAAAVRLQVRNTYGIELPNDFDPLNDPLKNISDVTLREGVKNILLNTATDFLKSPIKWLWTEPQMANVELRHTEFMETMTSAFPWSSDIEQIFDRGKDRIKNIVESDATVSVGPYNVLGHTVKYDVTLQEQENKRHDLRQAGRWLKIALALLTVVAVVIILLLFIGAIASTGFIATVIAPLIWHFVELLLSVSKVIKLATAFLAVSMLFTVPAIAPHVTTEHDNTLCR